MDLSWSEPQRELFNAVERFAAELNHHLIENDRAGVSNHGGWEKCGAMGIQGGAVPADHGSLGQNPLTPAGAVERQRHACSDNALVFSLNAHLWTIRMFLAAPGAENQRSRFLCDSGRDFFN